ncbi:MAG: hypothetical protein LBE92_05020 [Chryseobacterium sp.]|uniref:hypothetical protein n=1 Tax=Chryseobacterium sp. TaxID=1871047 RepID=UPI002832CAD1|nr:hypothetical protein [Chryseobacterium sp.]MDR2235462.1 hypothetical protein [Chryseobacterium sp.]
MGELSQDIAERLHYKDTIMIEYYVRLNEGRKMFILENENSNYKLPALVDGHIIKSNGSGLAIRVMDQKVNIDEILQLVEYTIINRAKINKYLQAVTFPYGENDYIDVQANSEEFISTILKKKSKIVAEVMKKNVALMANSFLQTKLFWENNEFVFGMNDTPPSEGYRIPEYSHYKIPDFNYYINSNWSDFFLISRKNEGLVYFDGMQEHTSPIAVPEYSSIIYPFNISKDRFSNKVIVSNNGESFYVYDIHKKTTLKVE